MTKARKRSPDSAKGQELFDLAFERAKEALQDKDVQKLLLEHGKAITDQVQQLLANRKKRAPAKDERNWLGGKFGQRKLERRVENLATTVKMLSAKRPELSEALAPATKAVDQIRVSVEIAGLLPVVKRKRAHLRVDKQLDHFEKMLFETTLPSLQGDG